MAQFHEVLPWLLLLGLGFFFGLAFEEFHARARQKRPGGVRSFPLLSLTGGLLYSLDPTPPWLVGVGLLAVSAWLTGYYWQHMREIDPDGFPRVGLMAPLCNVIAYLLGPVALSEPAWVAVGATVAAVLLLTARTELHALARRIELHEVVNAGRFLLLTGLVLPLLPDQPVIALTPITPHQVWLAMVAVSTVSYASYLLRRYVVPEGAGLVVALLGGLYSSTVTTVVLARRARADPDTVAEAESGIVLANAVMYLRLLLVILVFDPTLAGDLAPPMLALALLGLVLAAAWAWHRRVGVGIGVPPPGAAGPGRIPKPLPAASNPLGLGTAATFACLFVAVSILAAWVLGRFGAGGIYTLAGVIGITDINPFVLSLAQHGVGALSEPVRVGAVLVATASNNLFQAVYALGYSGGRVGIAPVAALALLAAGAIAAAVMLA